MDIIVVIIAFFGSLLGFGHVAPVTQVPIVAYISQTGDVDSSFSLPVWSATATGTPAAASSSSSAETEPTEPNRSLPEKRVEVIVVQIPANVPEPEHYAQPALPEAPGNAVEYVGMPEEQIEPTLEFEVTFGEPADQFSPTPYQAHARYYPLPAEPLKFSLSVDGGQGIDSGDTSIRTALVTEKDGAWDYYSASGFVQGKPTFTMKVGDLSKAAGGD